MKNNKILIIFAAVLIIGFLGAAQNANAVSTQSQDAKEQKTEPSAQSSNQDLLVIIEQLKKQIKELQDQFSKLTSEVATVKEEIKITKELYKGISGNEVKEVQKFLKQFSEIYPEGLVTGYYGPLTEKAVRKFQEREGLELTGKIDETTKKSINEYLLEGGKKIVICHYPSENPNNKQTLEISESAKEAHLAHGDTLDACQAQSTTSFVPESASTKQAGTSVSSPTILNQIKELQQLISDLQQKEQTPERILEISNLQNKIAVLESQKKLASSIGGIVVQVTGSGEKGVLCALTKDGLVYCQQDFMNKGIKSFTPLPTGGFVAIPGLVNVASIASFDDNRVCVVKTDGSAFCWGDNSYGQIGDGTLVAKTEPTQVFGLGLGTTASISMGRMHTCALKIDGSVVCWGSNDSGSGGGGQIGHGDKTKTIELFPVQVSGLGPKSTTALSSDYKGTCAIKTDGSVVCWGEIPPIGHSGTYAPVKIPQNLGAVKSLTIGFKDTFVLKSDGSVVGWGQNYCGQLGIGKKDSPGTPTQVIGLGSGSTAAIATDSYHSCALKTDGSVVCWGCQGRTGDGTVLNRYTPVQPVGLGAGTTAAISDTASCAVKKDGSVVCWGTGDIPTAVPGLK